MNIRKSVSVLVLMTAGQYAQASDMNPLQPRDLDGDPSTIDAYYYAPQNITWLATTNLGKYDAFGLQQGDLYNYADSSLAEVGENGLMFRETLPAFIDAVNRNNYLGYSDWRLPTAETADSGCLIAGYSSGRNCTEIEAPEFNQFLVASYGSRQYFPFTGIADMARVWLGSSGPTGRHHYTFGYIDRGGVGRLGMCESTTGIRNCLPAAVWLVRDGDVGTQNTVCVDTDGDGWGWDGVRSCRVETVQPQNECIDTAPANDGWGWNGVESCRIDAVSVCIDSQPVGDGWGWNGSTSCRITATATVCVDTLPTNDGWGWDGVSSCRI